MIYWRGVLELFKFLIRGCWEEIIKPKIILWTVIAFVTASVLALSVGFALGALFF